jgi:hypothetical protein
MAPPEPTVNQWFSHLTSTNNLDMNHTQDIYPSIQQNIYPTTTQTYNQNYPQVPQTLTQNYPIQNQAMIQNYPQNQPQNINRQTISLPTTTQVTPTPQVTGTQINGPNRSAMPIKSQVESDSDFRDPMKYFPPGSRKKQTGPVQTSQGQRQLQNVAPQIVESKFSA